MHSRIIAHRVQSPPLYQIAQLRIFRLLIRLFCIDFGLDLNPKFKPHIPLSLQLFSVFMIHDDDVVLLTPLLRVSLCNCEWEVYEA